MSILKTKEIYNKFGEDIIRDYKLGMPNKGLMEKYSIKYPQFYSKEKKFLFLCKMERIPKEVTLFITIILKI